MIAVGGIVVLLMKADARNFHSPRKIQTPKKNEIRDSLILNVIFVGCRYFHSQLNCGSSSSWKFRDCEHYSTGS